MNLLLLTSCCLSIAATSLDSTQNLPEIEVVTSLKQHSTLFEQPASTSSFSLTDIENNRIESIKNISVYTPNFYQPDYGSKMTSSMYVRGLGARIDQPAVGLYVDNMPVLNKNNYDFDFFDIQRVDVLRGPQSTLYGRNSIGGVINIYTLSPFSYQGTRLLVEYGNGNTLNLGLSTYQKPTDNFGYSIAAYHKQSDGFFTNIYDNSKAESYQTNGLRVRLQWQLNRNWTSNNITTLNYVTQNGFAYALLDTLSNQVLPINHNEPCAYQRFNFSNGLLLRNIHNNYIFESTTGLYYTNDKMTLDQDFLPESYFTIIQQQKEQALTQEFILKSNRSSDKWQWLLGLFGFYKTINMDAPVTFKNTGIEELILKNANAGLQRVFPTQTMSLKESEFPIFSNFELPNFGFSLYHQSGYKLGNLTFTAGIRLDFEQTAIRYNNSTTINYTIKPGWSDYRTIHTQMNGNDTKNYLELLPKLSVMYNFEKGNIYIAAAKGYKAGGYNTQIASDIVQTQMMSDMISDLGVYFETEKENTVASLSYKPEYSWNYEIGGSLKIFQNKINASAVVFYIDCTNQQLTVFPPGKSTGRKMSNAGHTRSFGTETTINYTEKQFRLTIAHGYTNVQFIEYNDGNTNYSGKYIPYAPQNTLAILCEYALPLNDLWLDKITLQADWTGVGKIYWNESNSLSQPFYGQMGSSIIFTKNNAKLQLWGKNLTNQQFNTFYFKSMGNSFVQQGKPLQIGATLSFTL